MKHWNDGSCILFETGKCIGGTGSDRRFPVFEQVQVNFHAFSHRFIGVLCTITFLYEALYVSSLPFDGTICLISHSFFAWVSRKFAVVRYPRSWCCTIVGGA